MTRVLLVAPYKSGTSYLAAYLEHAGVACVRLHAYDAVERARYPLASFTHFITLRRRDTRLLWLSALVEDLDDPSHYAYARESPVERETAQTIADLARHFEAQEWPSYRWLNFEYYDGIRKWCDSLLLPSLALVTEDLALAQGSLTRFLGCDLPPMPAPSHVTADGPRGSVYLALRRILSL